MNTQHKLLSSCPVSCFADEIAESLDRQIEVLSRLGISYVELRSADGINVSDFTMNFAKEVKKKLDQANIRISAIGSPIGKIGINDDFDAHLQKLSHTEQMADIFETPYIRMFSFYIPENYAAADCRSEVLFRTEAMIAEAAHNNITLLHENEKRYLRRQRIPLPRPDAAICRKALLLHVRLCELYPVQSGSVRGL